VTRVFVGIGSNIDARHNIATALDGLHRCFGELLISRVYRSRAVGFCGDDFLNLVVGFDCRLDFAALLSTLRRLENAGGRCRDSSKFSARTLDIDILTYGDSVGSFDGVSLPREDITRYAFVLQPLVDIAADERHPALQQSYRSLWRRFDASDQPLWPVDFVWRGRMISSADPVI
jgi:2-amino-4-hydroxy-6-hydroxymethyldihydropteridine diphosphokinase